MGFQGMIYEFYFGNTLQEYSLALALIVSSIIIARIVNIILEKYVKTALKRTQTDLDELLLGAFEGPFSALIIVLGIWYAILGLSLPPQVEPHVLGVVTAFFVLDMMWLIIRLIDIFINRILKPISSRTRTDLDDQLLPILSKGMKASAIILGFLIILSNFGFDVTALIAGLGIGGLAVALASKDTIENMFGAFAILLDKPFLVHDRVIIDGVTGDVLEVGLRSTRILTLDGTQLYVPNLKVVTSHIENLSRPDRKIAVKMTLGLVYQTSSEKMDEAKEILADILTNTEGVSTHKKPTISFNEFGASSLNIYMKYWVKDYSKRLKVVDLVNSQIKRRLEKAGLEFAYPTQTLYVQKD
jgi:MscS family membrane protein